MTRKSFDLSLLEEIKPVGRNFYNGESPYIPYLAGKELVPDFLPVTSERWQVRLNASTHDNGGILQHSNDEALKNTRRLEEKPLKHLSQYTYYDHDHQEGAKSLIVSYGITAAAAIDAVGTIRAEGKKVSLLIVKTLLPVPPDYLDIISSYEKVIIAEENINSQFASVLYGSSLPASVRTVGALGQMISPDEIIKQEAAL